MKGLITNTKFYPLSQDKSQAVRSVRHRPPKLGLRNLNSTCYFILGLFLTDAFVCGAFAASAWIWKPSPLQLIRRTSNWARYSWSFFRSSLPRWHWLAKLSQSVISSRLYRLRRWAAGRDGAGERQWHCANHAEAARRASESWRDEWSRPSSEAWELREGDVCCEVDKHHTTTLTSLQICFHRFSFDVQTFTYTEEQAHM